MGGENGTHKNKSEKRARLAPNGSSDASNRPFGALEPEAFKEENNGLTEPQEKDTTLKDFYFGDDDDDEDDEDDEWQPSKIPFDHENSFCINCTVRNYDCTASFCEHCGAVMASKVNGYDAFQAQIGDAISRYNASSSSSNTAFGFDERMLLHNEVFGLQKYYQSKIEMKSYPHPERPDRLRAIASSLTESGIFPEKCTLIQAREITREELLNVHSLDNVEAVEQTKNMLSSYFTPDTYANAHSACAAKLAAGICADLAISIMSGRFKNGFALVRPPGHHATIKQAMGFCLHNNAAVAAIAAQKAGAQKVLIVDWDVHHGNGTQEIFDGNKSVLYISLHRHEGGNFYPGTGAFVEVGTSGAEGFSVNIPWSCGGVGDRDYIFAFKNVVLPIAKEFAPDMTIISAGFDAARGDPLGGCDVTPAGYAQMAHMLTSLSDGKLLVVLEGGYNLRSISSSATAVVKVLLGEKPEIELEDPMPSKEGLESVLHVLQLQVHYWPVLSHHCAIVKPFLDYYSLSSDPRKETSKPTTAAAAKKDKVKASASSAGTAAPSKTTSGASKSRKRKDVPAASGKALTAGAKGKSSAPEKEKEKDKRKKKSWAGTGVEIRESGLPVEVSQALVTVVAPESGVPASTLSAISEPRQEELKQYLESIIPDQEKATGVVWKSNFPVGFSDSLGIHLPGYTAMQKDDSKRALNHARYSREVFRATATTHQKKFVQENSRAALNTVMSAVHDIGVFVGCLKDDYDKREIDMEFVNTDEDMIKKAVIERNYFRSLAADKIHQLEVKERELAVMKKEARLRELLVKSQKHELKTRSQELASQWDEMEARSKELEEVKAENARLQDELQRAGSEAVDRFLMSGAFTQAAPLACLDTVKFTVYRELKKIANIYPFTPEQAGFVNIPATSAGVKKLPGYKWNEKEDRLMNPDGTLYEQRLNLEDHPPRAFPHQWKKRLPWPADINVEEAEEELGGLSLAKGYGQR